MKRPKFPGFKGFQDRHGKWRFYHRKSKVAVDLEKFPTDSPAFLVECHRIAAAAAELSPQPGTLGMLIVAYKGSSDFLSLKPQTRLNYVGKLDYLQPLRDIPLALIDTPFVVKVRDRARERGDSFANYAKAVLSVVLRWGAERGYLDRNPAAGLKQIRIKRDADPNRPWSDDERHRVMEALPAHMRAAIGLMMYGGFGPKDALELPRECVRDNEIATRRSKTGEPVFLPMPSPLAAILSEAPPHDAKTVCANSEGQPWTTSGFRASWRPVRNRLERDKLIRPGLTLYGLRHTVAVILRETGFDERAIADYLGQRTIEMARHYARGADLQPKMRKMVTGFDAELDRRRARSVKPLAETVKPDDEADNAIGKTSIKSMV